MPILSSIGGIFTRVAAASRAAGGSSSAAQESPSQRWRNGSTFNPGRNFTAKLRQGQGDGEPKQPVKPMPVDENHELGQYFKKRQDGYAGRQLKMLNDTFEKGGPLYQALRGKGSNKRIEELAEYLARENQALMDSLPRKDGLFGNPLDKSRPKPPEWLMELPKEERSKFGPFQSKLWDSTNKGVLYGRDLPMRAELYSGREKQNQNEAYHTIRRALMAFRHGKEPKGDVVFPLREDNGFHGEGTGGPWK